MNDDLVNPNTGFDKHDHRDMEIISYVIDGELTHGDSLGNERTVGRGHVQYMSAGKGVNHSEYNKSDEYLRFLQIWINPEEKLRQPNYGDMRFEWDERKNKWLHMVSNIDGDAPIKIYQDANISVVELDKGNEIDFEVKPGRQAYLVQAEGSSEINGIELNEKDALEIVEEDITIKATDTSHVLVIEMKKPEK